MKTVRTLSYLLLALSAIASLGGLLLPNLYRDTEFYRLVWQNNDGVTLVLVIPALLVAIRRTDRGSRRAHLIWLGLLVYLFYNYAFYLFGAAFNWFFLLYVAIFALSVYALALGLWHLDTVTLSHWFEEKTPVRWIAAFLVAIALPLIIVEAGQCVRFISTGRPPASPSLIFALDLSFVVPNMILGAVLLWRRQAWGYVLAALMLVKGITYGAVLSWSATVIWFSDLPEKDALLPFYLFVLCGSLVFSWLLLKNLKPVVL